MDSSSRFTAGDKESHTSREPKQYQHTAADDTASRISRRRSSSSVTATTTTHHHGPFSQVVNGISAAAAGSGFLMRPNLNEKFDRRKVEYAMETVVREYMKEKTNYSADEAENWTNELSQLVNKKVKEFKFPRYKLCSIVTIGEHLGGGIHMGMKCLWDSDTDLYATYTYMTVRIYRYHSSASMHTNFRNYYRTHFS